MSLSLNYLFNSFATFLFGVHVNAIDGTFFFFFHQEKQFLQEKQDVQIELKMLIASNV